MPPQTLTAYPHRVRAALVAIGVVVSVAGCAVVAPSSTDEAPTAVPVEMTVTSNDFVDGGALDARFAACGPGSENISPSLSWEGAPAGTVSFAIMVIDLDAGGYLHWVHANLPANVTSVEAGTSRDLPGNSGLNALAGGGYTGPCPPDPGHRYEFTVWALDTMLTLDERPHSGHVLKESAGHIIGTGVIVGVY